MKHIHQIPMEIHHILKSKQKKIKQEAKAQWTHDRRITPPYSLIRCAPLLVGVASERSNFAHWLYQTQILLTSKCGCEYLIGYLFFSTKLH
jgi:hypothetical protein